MIELQHVSYLTYKEGWGQGRGGGGETKQKQTEGTETEGTLCFEKKGDQEKDNASWHQWRHGTEKLEVSRAARGWVSA